jgi:hypothetical protein
MTTGRLTNAGHRASGLLDGTDRDDRGTATSPTAITRSSVRSDGPSDVGADTHAVVGESGVPLDSATRTSMETRFGRDLSGVRVHTDSRAGQTADALGADAYTMGRHIVFAPDKFAPSTPHGRSLLAHELAHTIQQEGAADGRPSETAAIDPDPTSETQARTAGERLGAAPGTLTRASRVTLQRQPAAPAQAPPRPAFRVVGHGVSLGVQLLAQEQMEEMLNRLQPANVAELAGITIELHVIPRDKKLTDLPEFAHLRGTKTFDGRVWDNVRGSGGRRFGNVVRYSVAEEELVGNSGARTGESIGRAIGGTLGMFGGALLGLAVGGLLGPVGAIAGFLLGGALGLTGGSIGGAAVGRAAGESDGYARGFVGAHETGHIVGSFALTAAQRTELTRLFASRRRAGGPWLPPANYTSANQDEYFAQSVAAYFGRPYNESSESREKFTRAWLQRNDPDMHRFLGGIFVDRAPGRP